MPMKQPSDLPPGVSLRDIEREQRGSRPEACDECDYIDENGVGCPFGEIALVTRYEFCPAIMVVSICQNPSCGKAINIVPGLVPFVYNDPERGEVYLCSAECTDAVTLGAKAGEKHVE